MWDRGLRKRRHELQRYSDRKFDNRWVVFGACNELKGLFMMKRSSRRCGETSGQIASGADRHPTKQVQFIKYLAGAEDNTGQRIFGDHHRQTGLFTEQ